MRAVVAAASRSSAASVAAAAAAPAAPAAAAATASASAAAAVAAVVVPSVSAAVASGRQQQVGQRRGLALNRASQTHWDEYRPFRDDPVFARLVASRRDHAPLLSPHAGRRASVLHSTAVAADKHGGVQRGASAVVYGDAGVAASRRAQEAHLYALFRAGFQAPLLEAFRRGLVDRSAQAAAAATARHRASRSAQAAARRSEAEREARFTSGLEMQDPEDLDYTAQGLNAELEQMWGSAGEHLQRMLAVEEAELRERVATMEPLEPFPWASVLKPVAARDAAAAARGAERPIDRDTLLSLLGSGLPMALFQQRVSAAWLEQNCIRQSPTEMDDDFKAFLEDAGVPIPRFWEWVTAGGGRALVNAASLISSSSSSSSASGATAGSSVGPVAEPDRRAGGLPEVGYDDRQYREFWYPGQTEPGLSGRALLKLRAGGFDPRPFALLSDAFLQKMREGRAMEDMLPAFVRFLTEWNIEPERFWAWSQAEYAREKIFAERAAAKTHRFLAEKRHPEREGTDDMRSFAEHQRDMRSVDALIDSVMDEVRLVAGVEPEDPRAAPRFQAEKDHDLTAPIDRAPLPGSERAQDLPSDTFQPATVRNYVPLRDVKKGRYDAPTAAAAAAAAAAGAGAAAAAGAASADHGAPASSSATATAPVASAAASASSSASTTAAAAAAAAPLQRPDTGFDDPTLEAKRLSRWSQPSVHDEGHQVPVPAGAREGPGRMPAPRLFYDLQSKVLEHAPALATGPRRAPRAVNAEFPISLEHTRWPNDDHQHGPLYTRKVACRVYVPALNLPGHVEERLVAMATAGGRGNRYDADKRVLRVVSRTQTHASDNTHRVFQILRNLVAEAWKADPDYFPADDGPQLQHAARTTFRHDALRRDLAADIAYKCARGPAIFRLRPE